MQRVYVILWNKIYFSFYQDGGPGAVVKATCLEIAGSNPALALQVSNEQNVSSPLNRKDAISWRASVT